MRNRCSHSDKVILVDRSDLRWWWCAGCGATRMDTFPKGYSYEESLHVGWDHGRWRSPKNALTLTAKEQRELDEGREGPSWFVD